MTTTTEATYETDLADAREQMEGRIPTGGYPEGEREKAINDALNNTWSEGVTVAEWVETAARQLGQ